MSNSLFATMNLKNLCNQFKYLVNSVRIYENCCSQKAEMIDSQEVKENFKILVDVTSQFLAEAELLIDYYSKVIQERAEINELPIQLMKPTSPISDEEFEKMTKKVMIELGDKIMELENQMIDLYGLLTIIIFDEEFEEWDSD